MEVRRLDRFGAAAEGHPGRRIVDGRLVGQSWETACGASPDGPLTAESIGEVIAGFHDTYQSRNGNRFDGFPVEGVTYRVEIVVPADKVEYTPAEAREPFEDIRRASCMASVCPYESISVLSVSLNKTNQCLSSTRKQHKTHQ